MSLLIVLPSERVILAKRRSAGVEDKAPIMHAIDSDVFHYLCAKTDWSTGSIGIRSKVSYPRIALELTEDIPRKPSRTMRIVKRKSVYNSVQRLIKAGLFMSEFVVGEDKNALLLSRVHWQQLLNQAISRDSKNNPDSRQLANFVAALLRKKVINNSELLKNEDEVQADRYCSDGIYQKTINLSNAAVTQFRMVLTWEYDQDLVELFLQASGFSSHQIKQVWFGKYVQYWSGEAIKRTQREWSVHFANHMQGYLLRPDFFEKMNGMLEDEERPSATQNRRTTTTTVPMLNNGSQLQAWAIGKGLPTAPVGWSTTQYYQLLCNTVERQASQKEQ